MLQSENASAIVSFIFKDILCHWGAVSELVIDNCPAFVQALYVLTSRYGICHIQISPYNSQANGVVEQHYYNVQEAIVKSTLGGEIRWSATAHSVFWAEHVTILKSTGLLPYFMIHGAEPLFPFDLSEAMFLVPVPDTDDMTTPILIAWWAHQLQKYQEEIDTIHEWVLLSRFASLRHFKQQFKNRIHQQDFSPGDLVLVCNSQIEKELNRKMKPHYLGLMVVLCRTTGGSYLLAEFDGAISHLQYVAFWLLLYYLCIHIAIPVMDLTRLNDWELDDFEAEKDVERDNEDEEEESSN